jgi:hypothetical protein
VAVAATALVLGFFVLTTQRNVFSQIIGALRIENAVALLEAHGEGAAVHPAARVAQLVVLAGAIGLYVWYLQALAARPAADHDDDPDAAVVPGEEAS